MSKQNKVAGSTLTVFKLEITVFLTRANYYPLFGALK